MKKRILFVDDDAAGRKLALYNLRQAGYAVVDADSGEAALELFDPTYHDLVVSDLRMKGMSGLELLDHLRTTNQSTPVLIITAYGTIDVAVEAMKKGAEDFILKPFSKEQLVMAVAKALEHRRLKSELKALRIKVKGVERPIIHNSKAMRDVLAVVDRVAATNAPMLISGPSGTGKELLARRLHVKSDRAEQPFVAVNCASIPNELLEAELFGHAKGAFTGASKARLGRFRQADGGTLLLDEIGDFPLNLQTKLLRVLQEQIVDVIGQDHPVLVNVRIVSATNQDLANLISGSLFREDLFYRLNVVSVQIPPLRERPEDIPALIEHFVQLYGEGRELEIPPNLVERLLEYDWPGNVRELENLCNRLVILCKGNTLSVADLPQAAVMHRNAKPGGRVDALVLPEEGLSLVNIERDLIERVLTMKKWNVTQAAVYLGVPRHVLTYRMQKYAIKRA